MASEAGGSGGQASGSGGKEGGEPARATLRVRYCAVYTCLHNYKTHPHLMYFTIPTAPKRCLKWLKKIRRMDILKNGTVSGYHRVCEVHFRPEDIGVTATGSRRRLLARAVPALRLPEGDCFVTVHEPPPAPTPPPEAAPAPLTTRTRVLTASDLEIFEYIDQTPRRPARKRPRPEPKRAPRRQPPAPPGALADFFAACDRHLNPDMAGFVKRMAQVAQPSGGCPRLLLRAPAAYRLLAPALALPPAAALRRRLHRHPLERLADLLELRVKRMTDIEKHCTVSVDLVAVRPHLYYDITADRIVGLHEVDGVQEPEPARRCAVLTARALCGAWAQPVAACCLASRDAALLHAWTDAAIHRLLAAGLRVRALVADPDAPAARRPGVDAARPYFDVDGHRIYFIYDPARLMRLLLSEFIAHDFHFEGSVARWADVARFRELERRRPFPLAPRLAELPAAAAPRHARRLPPRRAARLLGRGLAAALADTGGNAPATAKFIFKMNDLFDALDSPAESADRDSAGGSVRDSGRTGFLEYMRSFFGRLKLRDEAGVEPPDSREFVERWQVTIAAVLALRERLPPPRRALPTRRLRLDTRVAAAARRVATGPPTCRQTLAAFKKRFFADILRATDDEATVDLHEFLERASSIDATPAVSRDRFEFEEEELEVRPRDYRGGWRRRGSVAAVAARLMLAVRRVHGHCPAAAAWLAGAGPARLAGAGPARLAGAGPARLAGAGPARLAGAGPARLAGAGPARLAGAGPAPLRWLVLQLDAALAAALGAPRQAAAARLADLLLDVHVLDCAAPCGCFPLQYLKRLFLRMRLHDVLRRNQAEFKKGGDDVQFHLDLLD